MKTHGSWWKIAKFIGEEVEKLEVISDPFVKHHRLFHMLNFLMWQEQKSFGDSDTLATETIKLFRNHLGHMDYRIENQISKLARNYYDLLSSYSIEV